MRLFREKGGVKGLVARLRDRAAIAAERATAAMTDSAWRREALAARLAPAPELAATRQALQRARWDEAHRRLLDHYRGGPRRFPLHPSDRLPLVRRLVALCPQARVEARARGNAIAAGQVTLLGYRSLDVGRPPDWHRDPQADRRFPLRFWATIDYLDPTGPDHKVVWELNRHQHWLALGRAAWLTGDDRYRHVIIGELRSWLEANPPLVGVNWASMLEIGLRSLSWLWTLSLLAAFPPSDDETPWTVDLLLGLDRQLRHIERHLSTYFSPNTHLLGEALALYVTGRALPELAAADRWARTGRRILLDEAHRQVLPDGGHAERSAHYHRYALDFFLLALAEARLTGDEAAAAVFREVVSRLADFAAALAGPGGMLPLLGDDDGGQLFPMCGREPADARPSLAWAAWLLDRPDLLPHPVPEEALWLCAWLGAAPRAERRHPPATAARPITLRRFDDTGYWIAATRAGDRVVLDAGRHGFLNGGHAHADALSMLFDSTGRPLLVDPGTATYTIDPALRDRFRTTAFHNTVVIDGRSQAAPRGPFHWRTRADARPLAAIEGSDFVYLEAEHDAYAPLQHRRSVLLLEDGLAVVVDVVSGDRRRHRADIYWHFDPSWRVHAQSHTGAVLARAIDGPAARAIAVSVSSIQRLVGVPGGQGWHAPVYGRVVPAPVLQATREADGAFGTVTVVAPPGEMEASASLIAEVELGGWYRGAFDLRVGANHWVLLIASEAGRASEWRDLVPPAPASSWNAAGWQTDARLALVRRSAGGVDRAVLVGGTHLRRAGDGPGCSLVVPPEVGWCSRTRAPEPETAVNPRQTAGGVVRAAAEPVAWQ
ncbi:MAG TPA: alginate lyase family protein [Vicinamibacterales bacterium]|nr:alginate lyase family protein [Vicinamibacterales bacterium]